MATGADRKPNLTATADGFAVSFGGRRLTGSNPRASMARRLPHSLQEQTVYLVISPLFGYGLADLARRLPRRSALILIEAEDALRELWSHPEAEIPVSPRVQAPATTNPDLIVQRFNILLRSVAPRRLVQINLSGGYSLHRQHYDQLATRLESALKQFWTNRATEVVLGRRWMSNLMVNLLQRGRPAEELRHSLTRNVVLVGAGPSLRSVLPELAAISRGSRPDDAATRGTTIAAVDTVLPTLAAAGIVPDMIFSLDGQFHNSRDFLPRLSHPVPICCDLTTYSAVVRVAPPDRRFFVLSRFAPIRLLDEEQTPLSDVSRVPALGSVAATALHVLSGGVVGISNRGTRGTVDWPVRQLTLVGVDFYYSHPEMTHAPQSPAHRNYLRTANRLSPLPQLAATLKRPTESAILRNGKPAMVDGVLLREAQLLKQTVSEARARGVAVHAVGHEGLPLGAEIAQSLEAVDRLTESGPSPSPGATAARPAQAARPTPTEHPSQAARPTPTARPPPETAEYHQWLVQLYERLIEQERVLTAVPPERAQLDSGLDFVGLDLPEWFNYLWYPETRRVLHPRVLASVRDYRRRLGRILGA